jgi:sodium-coupled neutral amino acid transporter 11
MSGGERGGLLAKGGAGAGAGAGAEDSGGVVDWVFSGLFGSSRGPSASRGASYAEDDFGDGYGGGGGYGTGKGGAGGAQAPRGMPYVARNSLLLTAMTFANGVVGAGIIGLPGALNQAGFALGLAMCVLVALLSAWTLRLLAEVGEAHGIFSYPELAQRAFGSAGFYIVCGFQALFALGAMCSYLVIFADTLPAVLRASTSLPDGHPLLERTWLLLAGSAAVLLPLSLLRHYAQLARVSVVKMAAMLVLAACVVYFKYDAELLRGISSVKTDAWKYEEPHADAFPALGTMAFAFVCHHQVFLAHGSMRDPTPRRFALMVNLAILMSLSLSLLVAAFGYTTFFETTKGDIFVNYEAFPHLRKDVLLTTARLLLALNMLVTYPSEMMVLRDTVEGLLERRRRHLRWVALRAPVHDVVLLAQLRQEEFEEALRSADAWRCGERPTRALFEHVGATLALYGVTLAVALATKNLNSVLNVTGSFTAVMLAFVLPAAIRLRLGRDPYDEAPVLSCGNVPTLLLLAFGVLAFMASTGLSLASAVAT